MKKILEKKYISKFFYLVLGVLLVELINIFTFNKKVFCVLSILTLIVVALFEVKEKNNYNIIRHKDIVK
ncbi:hypothetical protein [Clostridium sp.]|mgnify:CR=1 FL=1|uniref:hypothetical protein n=1 Tax=Clostridium sp. TaxID=1506 RepID=UPI0039918454